ncbi:MAG TPA: hypothetical protein VLA93_08990 [Pyrinomonadaceae bacterium]|nr:hypothetical protein [Pyrinomonadaceae bacterium]
MKPPSLLAILLLLCANSVVAAQPNQSVYTSVDPKQCRTIKSTGEEGGSYEGRCRGVAGYNLIVEEGDLRTNMKVVAPGGSVRSLDLWTVVSSAFSSLGPKVEWRMAKRAGRSTPVALIIRYIASENVDNPNKPTSYLAVAKITSSETCITDKILPGPNANTDARRAADAAATKGCLKK